MMSRKRKLDFPFSSSLSNSFCLFSLHFPLHFNCQSNCKRKKHTHSEDPNSGVSSSLTSSPKGDYEGGTKETEGHNYEVFLSFSGKDTRKNFADHLYESLVEKGIHVFRDEDEIPIGDKIGPKLLCSITQCKISIPIISNSYASSKWCLRELVQILKCRESQGQLVWPIFYKVEPSQVKHLEGKWKDDINAHKENVDDLIVEEWKKALKQIGSLKGLQSETYQNGHEGALVKAIVREAMQALNRPFLLNVPKQLVGIDDCVEDIMTFINARSSSTSIIGIRGMGGIGKTTLGKFLYNELSTRYKRRSFLANIRGTSESKGIESIQKDLISNIIGGSCDVSNVDHGLNILKSRCSSEKVLVLLDDVDDDSYLDALVGDDPWFKAGSIVIVTTRKKSILKKVQADCMHELKKLPSDQSLILFSRHAFRKDSPKRDYEEISRAIVNTTGGLPLALKLIGSSLCGKPIENWEGALRKLEKVPEQKVLQILKISYDELEDREKQIFLDVACFFIGDSPQIPTYMWEACRFNPRNALEVLDDRSLIELDEEGMLAMHDLLRDLGREIVCSENLTMCQEHTRLWDEEDAKDVLDGNKGTSKIEALRLGEGSYAAENFKKLTSLRFLEATGARVTGNCRNLLPELRWFVWSRFCLDINMANFHLKELIVLDLQCAPLSENWEGWVPLRRATKLKVLNLSESNLTITPDLSAFKNLEILILQNCMDLEELHPSIENIETLISLDLTGCSTLEELPEGLGRMENLRELLLEGTQVQQIPISKGFLTKLEILDASGCELVQIPESLGSLTSLTELYLGGTIEEIPESIGSLKKLKIMAVECASLTRIPTSIGNLASLSGLYLSGCHKLARLPEVIGNLTLLTKLCLTYMTIEALPESIGFLKKLETLDVSYCASLAHIPTSIGFLASLSRINLRECHKITQLPSSIGSLVSLQCLSLSGCCSLRKLPDSIENLTSLTELHLIGTAIEKLPESIGSLKKLETLDASCCASLAHIPTSIGDLASLSRLNLRECHKLTQLPSSIGSLVSLQFLVLSGCCLLRKLPDSIRSLTSLTDLYLCYTAIENLPESIGSLKKLTILYASHCASLAHLPTAIGDLASLVIIDLKGCHKLTQLPSSIGSLVSLEHLVLSGCRSLRQLPDSIRNLTSLTSLHLRHTAIMELPFGDMQNLWILDIGGTPIVKLLDDGGLLAELQGLRASMEGLPGYTSQPNLPDNLDLDKLQKLSELRSRILALVLLKHPRTPPANNSAMDYQTADSEHVLKRSRPFESPDEPPAITKLGSGHVTAGASLGDRHAPMAAMVGMDSETMADLNRNIADNSGDKSRLWKLTEINELSQCWSTRLPDNLTATRVLRLTYTNSGGAILALSSNAVHKLWKWQESDQNLTGRATTSIVPQLWQPHGRKLMTNDTSHTDPEIEVPCFSLSKKDSYLISASGGMISLFNMINFQGHATEASASWHICPLLFTKVVNTILPADIQTIATLPPALAPQNIDPVKIAMEGDSIEIYSGQVDKVQKKLKLHQRKIIGFSFSTFVDVLVSSTDSQTKTTFVPERRKSTFLAFYPRDNNIVAIGMEDSSIQIYHVQAAEFKEVLRGHQARITGLAFSNVLNALVSSGADSQLCVWSTDGWEKRASKFLQMPTGRGAAPLADTRVQFHKDQIHLLVVHETQITIYQAPKLECLQQWVPRKASCLITDATYSCNGQSIYVSFEDGSIGVLTASTLTLRCRINPAAYIPPNPGLRVYPLVIAAHPSKPNQFALGLTDGSVYVLEPLESEGKWDTCPIENGAGPSTTSGATDSDQP